MPNRILKETICTSETLDALSEAAENFFYRLLVQCDDFGRLDARPAIVRAKCYPLRLDKVSIKDIDRLLGELETAGLLWRQVRRGKARLQLLRQEEYIGRSYRPARMIHAWRAAVLDRDGYTCQYCGARGVKLQAHHLRPWCLDHKARLEVINGITLCKGCHGVAHQRGWKALARQECWL